MRQTVRASAGRAAGMRSSCGRPWQIRPADVLNLLIAHGEATPTILAAELPFTRQAVAKHFAVLDHAGLVEGHRAGREVRDRACPGRVDQAARAMAEVAAQLDRQLQAIKRIAEAAARATTADTPDP